MHVRMINFISDFGDEKVKIRKIILFKEKVSQDLTDLKVVWLERS